jgi:hypothetical protein
MRLAIQVATTAIPKARPTQTLTIQKRIWPGAKLWINHAAKTVVIAMPIAKIQRQVEAFFMVAYLLD